MVIPVRTSLLRLRGLCFDFSQRNGGSSAVEFAMIVPIMLVLFFGTQEFSSAITVSRKVTSAARTLSDLVSQSTSVSDIDLTNLQITAKAILTPYEPSPLNSTVSELYVDPTSKTTKVIWSQGSNPIKPGTTVTIPAVLAVDDTYLIFSEVNYKYVPIVGYSMEKAGVTLSDSTYTRPRQNSCVIYPTPTSGALPNCPTK